MRKVKRWRYYCEFCRKSGGSSYHIEMHEKGCTNNPQRECGMCRMAGYKQAPLAELIAALGVGDKEGMEKLAELANGCPACMLAALRLSGVMEPPEYDPETGCGTGVMVDVAWPGWDFKTAKKEFWAGVKDETDHARDIEAEFWGQGYTF